MLSQKQIRALNKAQQSDPSYRLVIEQELKDEAVWLGDMMESTQVALAVHEIEIATLQSSAPSTPKIVSQTITPGSPNQIQLIAAPNGSSLTLVKAVVKSPFNLESELTIGTNVDHSRFLSVQESDLQDLSTFISTSTEVFNQITNVVCYFNPNGSTTGEVEVQVTYA